MGHMYVSAFFFLFDLHWHVDPRVTLWSVLTYKQFLAFKFTSCMVGVLAKRNYLWLKPHAYITLLSHGYMMASRPWITHCNWRVTWSRRSRKKPMCGKQRYIHICIPLRHIINSWWARTSILHSIFVWHQEIQSSEFHTVTNLREEKGCHEQRPRRKERGFLPHPHMVCFIHEGIQSVNHPIIAIC